MLNSLLKNADKDFAKRGFSVLRQLIPSDLILELTNEYERLIRLEYTKDFGKFCNDDGFPLVLNHVDNVSDFLFDVARSNFMCDAAQSILNSPVVPLQVEYFAKPPNSLSTSPQHQDQIFYQGHFTDEIGVAIWIALTDVTETTAPLAYFPTDKLELLEHKSSNRIDFDFELSKPLHKDFVTIPLRPGDAVVHHAFVVHSSLPNFSNIRRLAIAFNYRTSEFRRSQCYVI